MERGLLLSMNCTLLPRSGGVFEFANNLAYGMRLLGLKHVRSSQPPAIPLQSVRRPARFLLEVLLEFKHRNEDIAILYPNYFFLPWPYASGKRMVVVHDLQFKFYPQYISSSKRMFLDASLRLALAKADGIVFISETTKQHFEEHYGRPRKSAVIPNPIDLPAEFNTSTISPHPYIFANLHFYPHKRIDNLLAWFSSVSALRQNLRLVLTGHGGERMAAWIKEHPLREKIQHLGYIPKSEMVVWMKNAFAFASFSEFEGFNMSAAEAACLQVPAVLSRIPVHTELFSDYAYLIDDVNDAQAALNYIESFRTDPRVWHLRFGVEPAAVAERYLQFSKSL